MRADKTSLIVTTYNEQNSIGKLIDSILKQSKLPDEVIVVDGGSRDKTIKEIERKRLQNKGKLQIRVIKKIGNRSIGRNEATKVATGNIILCTDAGCILDKNWVKNIIKPFENKKFDVVAGYYKGLSGNIFQKSLVPYVLVMEDKIKDKFLPSTRSMGFRKSVWEKVGGFNEKLSHNEDYDFAKKLEKNKSKILFAKDAVVYWIPRKNLKEVFIMFFRFSLGDIQANILREKVLLIFLRYFLMVYFLLVALVLKSFALYIIFVFLILLYFSWTIYKNYKYVKDCRAFFYLPLFQLTSDMAVMLGSFLGLVQKIYLKNIWKLLLANKWFFLIVLIYIAEIILVIDWGIPNNAHPFNYHMDEWHFSQAIRTFLKYGTGSISGAASIPLFHIVSTIFFLAPFYLAKIINPAVIKNSLDNIPVQHNLFEILRLHTLFYGVLSVSTIFIFLKKSAVRFSLIFTGIFAFTPLWIFLSNFYKYDIALTFWIILTIYFIFRFYKTQKIENYLLAGAACGLALSTKFTAAPLFAGFLFSYFIFCKRIKIKQLTFCIFSTVLIFAFLGIPDFLFNKGSYWQLINSTLVQPLREGTILNLRQPVETFLFFNEYFSIFGYILILLSYISFLYWTVLLIKKIIHRNLDKYKFHLFFYVTNIFFLISLFIFGLDGGGNRALVLLPFMVIFSAFFIEELITKLNLNVKQIKLLTAFLIFGLIFQFAQSFSWTTVKFFQDPRVSSSNWIIDNIPVGSTIGIENIPIYQSLPDLVLKEYSLKEYAKKIINRYKYEIVSPESKLLPKYVVFTQDYKNMDYIKKSPKKDLFNKLKKEKYKRVAVFSPDLRFFDLFSDRLNFIIIFPSPITIAIYEK
ncbi:MAG: hypothetical protein COX78_01085 [Candidatus Levybacteria bacterium CG_4_10_14_0_2_um_filter_35_8]|nr:MAG: hypothetical protein COX78_01085 [Candidatus Levybacteria bacterium CG_4_10_14_0_2_um_filter_35_8]